MNGRRLWRHVGIHAHAQIGMTALMNSASGGHVDCMRVLLDAGADKEAKDNVRFVFVCNICGWIVAVCWVIFK